jgi:hypothetical protein
MRRVATITVALLWIGCGNHALVDNGADMAVGDDLAAPADLAVHTGGPGDLGFGTDTDGGLACVPGIGSAHAQYVWNAMVLPQQRADFAWDLNGDGRVDNQYGNIVGALSAQTIDVQGAATQAIAVGQSITLVDERSMDAAFASDACAATTMYAGLAMTSPDYSGTGHFTIDGSATVGHFTGPIASARFTSEPSPATAQVPSTVQVNLAIFGSTPVTLVGARVTYQRGANGSVTGGQLNGAIRKYDVDHQLVPDIAAALTLKVQTDPSSSSTMQILSIFDNGGKASPACAAGTCQNLDGSCAVAQDNVISDCEVGTSGLIQNLLAPDVQLFDAAGNYRPNPANTTKDSLSVGLGFTAVPATF